MLNSKFNFMSKKVKEKSQLETLLEMDMSKIMAMDLSGAISLLTIIRDTPEVYSGVLDVLEKYRSQAVDRIKRQQELDRLEKEKKAQGEVLKPVE